ncbi:hypothetical protein A3A20_01060 [Candidatus Wolfebacteria bacterium RIFCSPLOWO2_01_FULL_45_19]|uniref:Metallo-beta-lactamase domain-containing protein n=1 Tax=Candidatus Wolfebacteria bacterium RIFCSPLOWO2_01_FULL_45_19 TaxID=1802557 RepID=A0A1F8DQX6_9BACT|nr:MAG: hypothetical protein A3A20_01060 [Candidatus Wolfebacteria bacterium RIFCSPLOWO2_01_FULL_45_19]
MTIDKKRIFQLAVFVLVGFNVWVWYPVFVAPAAEDSVYFLDVGQGDSQLVVLSNVKILIDGGRNKRVLNALDSALGQKNNKYIDILLMTHPELDHYGGFIEVLRRYDVGLFISNGQVVDADEFRVLKNELAAKNVPVIELREGDAIRHKDAKFSVFSPDKALLEKGNPNEAGIVMMFENGEARVLFTGDIGFLAENILIAKDYDLNADVLKIGHHGSKNSSGENFIAAVLPAASVIGVGQNSYGHPAPQTLKTLEWAGSKIYRTDKDGTVKIVLYDNFSSENKTPARWLPAMLTGRYKSSTMLTLSLAQLKNGHDLKKAESFAREAVCVDINTASSERLTKIRHIGAKRAQLLIEARPFVSIKELIRVKDIGPLRLADILAEGKACVL